MAINQITKVRMPDGSEVALTDWSARPLYSTADLLDGFTDEEIRVFSYACSDRVASSQNLPAAARRVATLRDTNISGASEMDSTEEYLVYSIRVEVHQFAFNSQTNQFDIDQAGLPLPNGPNMAILHNRIIGELEISEKAFSQAGLGWFCAGFGPFVSTDAAAPARSYAVNGAPSHEAPQQLSIPSHIGGTEDYSFILLNPAAAAVEFHLDNGNDDNTALLQLRVYLDGLHKRPTA